MTYYEEIVDSGSNFFLKRIYVEQRKRWTAWEETEMESLPPLNDRCSVPGTRSRIKSEGRFVRVRGLKRLLMGGRKFVQERRSLYECQVQGRIERQDTGVPCNTDDILREESINRARVILDARIEARKENARIMQAVYDGEI